VDGAERQMGGTSRYSAKADNPGQKQKQIPRCARNDNWERECGRRKLGGKAS
jgi:hypothetical protein